MKLENGDSEAALKAAELAIREVEPLITEDKANQTAPAVPARRRSFRDRVQATRS